MPPADNAPNDTNNAAPDAAQSRPFVDVFWRYNRRERRGIRDGVERVAAGLHQLRRIYSGQRQADDMLAEHNLPECAAPDLRAVQLNRWRKSDGLPLFDHHITDLGEGVYRHSSGLCFTVSAVADPRADTRTILVTFGGTSAGPFRHRSTLVRSVLNGSDTARQWWHNVRAHRGHRTAISDAALEILGSAQRYAARNPDLISNVTAAGHSLGAGVAYRAAAALYTPENPINTLLFDCPPTALLPGSMRRLEGYARAGHTTPTRILRHHNVHIYGQDDVVMTPAPFMADNVAPVIASSFPIENPRGLSGIAAHNRFDEVVLQTDNASSLLMFDHVGSRIAAQKPQRRKFGTSQPAPQNGKFLAVDAESHRFWDSAAQSGKAAPGAAHAMATAGATKALRLN